MDKKNKKTTKNNQQLYTIGDLNNQINLLAQNDALESVEVPTNDEFIDFFAEDNLDNETPVQESSKDVIDVEPTSEKDVEDIDTDASNDVQNDNKNLETLVAEKFYEKVKDDIQESKLFIENLKASHKKDYDSYVKKLKSSKYYQKRLKYWQDYYADIRKKCEEEAKVELGDEDLNINKTKDVAKQEDVLKDAEATKTIAENPQPKTKKVAKEENKVDVLLNEKARPSVSTVDTSKIVPITLNDEVPLDTRLAKTVLNYVLAEFYESAKDMRKINEQLFNSLDTAKKYKNELDFKKNLAIEIVYGIDILLPKQTKPDPEAVKRVQNNIKTRMENLNMDVESIAQHFIDNMFHVELNANQRPKISGFIPELSTKLAKAVQDVLIANDITEFDINQEGAEKIVKSLLLNKDFVENLTNDSLSAQNGKMDKETIKRMYNTDRTSHLKVLFNNIENKLLNNAFNAEQTESLKLYAYDEYVEKPAYNIVNQKVKDMQNKDVVVTPNLLQSMSLSVGQWIAYDVDKSDKIDAKKKEETIEYLKTFENNIVDLMDDIALDIENSKNGKADVELANKHQQSAKELIGVYVKLNNDIQLYKKPIKLQNQSEEKIEFMEEDL